MKKLVLLLLVCSAVKLYAQYSPDDMVGTYYKMNIKEVKLNDTVQFLLGDIDSKKHSKYLMWKINDDNTVKVKASFTIKREGHNPNILLTTKNKKWRYFKESNSLFIENEKYKVLMLNAQGLLLTRIE